MTEYTSEIKTISCCDECIFSTLSDLSNLERIKDRIPQDHLKNFSFTKDSCSFEVNPVGKIDFHIVSREPHKTIKFATTNSPFPLFLWIQLKQTGENVTKMKMTVRAELNPLFKTMIAKPIQEGLNKLADAIAAIPYE